MTTKFETAKQLAQYLLNDCKSFTDLVVFADNLKKSTERLIEPTVRSIVQLNGDMANQFNEMQDALEEGDYIDGYEYLQ